MKTYIAMADNGRDFIDFEFESEYRANSKNNKEDAVKYYKDKHGYNVKILKTFLK